MSDLPCRSCKTYRDCVLVHPIVQERDVWYHFGELRFCPFQVIWILSHKDTLQSGDWPPEHREVAGSRQFSSEARFARPVLIIAEVMQRLESCGLQGELLLSQVEAGRTYHTLSQGAKAALKYCSGFKRKQRPFSKWRWDENKRYPHR